MFKYGYNMKGLNQSINGFYESYIPSVFERIARQKNTKLLRSHCAIDWYYQNKAPYLTRMEEADKRGLTYIFDYYKTYATQSAMGQQFPPNKDRWIKWCIDIIKDMHAAGYKDRFRISIGNEPNNEKWWLYAHDCLEAIVAQTNYDAEIIVPLNGAATTPGIANSNPEYLTDVYDQVIWGFAYYWWWHLAYDWKTKKRNLNYPGTYDVVWNWLQNKGLITLFQNQPCIAQEFGKHYGPNSNPHTDFGQDLEAFTNMQIIFNKFQLDYCMEAIAPRRGGYDFPTWGREDSQTSPTNCNNAETPQSRVFLETVPDGAAPPPPPPPPPNGKYVSIEQFDIAMATVNQRIENLIVMDG
jgi:hypothetical protein